MDGDRDADRRKERIARNEALFREVNERVKEVTADPDTDRIDFLCECGNSDCTDAISLDRTEYERLRADPLLFGVKPGHAIPEVEDVVAEDERFQTVRKRPNEGRIALETDPRA
jgi:hypothetical protein